MFMMVVIPVLLTVLTFDDIGHWNVFFFKLRCVSKQKSSSSLRDIVQFYQSSGIIGYLPQVVFRANKMTVHNYHQCCIHLQMRELTKYRHFLFVTGRGSFSVFVAFSGSLNYSTGTYDEVSC